MSDEPDSISEEVDLPDWIVAILLLIFLLGAAYVLYF
jgi:hypothetical protein